MVTENSGMIPMPYGKDTVFITAPRRYSVAVPEVLKKEHADDEPAQQALVAAALEDPIRRPGLVPWLENRNKIAIIVPDITRMSASALYLKPLIAQLDEAGVAPESVRIIVAVGNHRSNTRREIENIVGREVLERFDVTNHDPFGDLFEVGTTKAGNAVRINRKVAEADAIILTGAAAYHIFAGYSGGRKSLLPGVSASETILFNHALMFKDRRADERAEMGILRGNPVNEDMIEALLLIGAYRMFMLNTVCDPRGIIIGAFAGCPLKAHEAACGFVSAQFSVDFSAGFDIVVMSSGGAPFDGSFYQAYKGAYCLLDALNPGGKLVIIAECPEGYGEKAGNTEFWFSKSMDDLLDCCAAKFDMNGKVAFDIRRISEKAGKAYLVTEDDETLISTVGLEKIEKDNLNGVLEKLISEFETKKGSYPKILFVPYGTWTLVKNNTLRKDYSFPDY